MTVARSTVWSLRNSVRAQAFSRHSIATKDEEIVRDEYDYVDKLWSESRDVLLAISPGGSGDITESHVKWGYRRPLPNTPSPVLHDGHLYMVKKGGIVNCINVATGKSVSVKQRRVSAQFDYYSSPVVGDGKIYLTNDRGTPLLWIRAS